MNQRETPGQPGEPLQPAAGNPAEGAGAAPLDLSAFWMPFTANRQFKSAPRLLAKAKGMYYTSHDGRRILRRGSGA
jgi:beta-alanine--pyruvate transaminase